MSLNDLERDYYLTTPAINPLPEDSLADLRMKYYAVGVGSSISDTELQSLKSSVSFPRGDSLEDYRRAGRYQQLGTPFLNDGRSNADLFMDVLTP